MDFLWASDNYSITTVKNLKWDVNSIKLGSRKKHGYEETDKHANYYTDISTMNFIIDIYFTDSVVSIEK